MVQGLSRRKTQIAHNKNLIKFIKSSNCSCHWIHAHALFMIKLIDTLDWVISFSDENTDAKVKELDTAIKLGNFVSNFYIDMQKGVDIETKYKDFLAIENGDVEKTLADLSSNFYSYVAKHITNWYE